MFKAFGIFPNDNDNEKTLSEPLEAAMNRYAKKEAALKRYAAKEAALERHAAKKAAQKREKCRRGNGCRFNNTERGCWFQHENVVPPK